MEPDAAGRRGWKGVNVKCEKAPTDRGSARRSKATDDDAVSSTEAGPRTRSPVAQWFGRCFYACGNTGLPKYIDCLGTRYLLARVLKHDFMAATALYEAEAVGAGRPGRLICKNHRRMHFCWFPLGWFGRLLMRREIRNLRRCEGIVEVPVVLARLGPSSFVYEYVEGKSLDDMPSLPVDYFDRLADAVRRIHERNLVHFDLNKPGNILVDEKGRPHVIDFQVSVHLGDRFLLSRWLSGRVRRRLQAYDIYHVYKQKRRLQPNRLTEDEDKLSRNHSLPLRIHRAIARPYKLVRRSCLRYLHAKGILLPPDRAEVCAETDPARWERK